VRSLSKIVAAVMAKAGLDESAHALRHTWRRGWYAITRTTSC
jgi:hypothetical protein